MDGMRSTGHSENKGEEGREREGGMGEEPRDALRRSVSCPLSSYCTAASHIPPASHLDCGVGGQDDIIFRQLGGITQAGTAVIDEHAKRVGLSSCQQLRFPLLGSGRCGGG